MRFSASLDVFLPADLVAQPSSLWDRLKSLTGNARTALVRDRVAAASFVFEFRRALDALAIDNARSLVVDGLTVFHDAGRTAGDLPDLILALTDHVAAFGEGCDELRFAVDHEEAGLVLALDATVRSEHGQDTPSARITVLGQLEELMPRPGEAAGVFRDRVGRFVDDASRLKAVQLQFTTFVGRLEGEVLRRFPEGRVVVGCSILDAPLLAGGAQVAMSPRAQAAFETATPARNFSLSTEQRIAALMGGPPQYSVRLRTIEDLETELVQIVTAATSSATVPIKVVRGLERLNALITDHNKNYPVERNLPIDVATGKLMDGAEPWVPRKPVTLDGLRARARIR